MSADYEPTIGDIWPTEESTPPEARNLLRELYEDSQRRLEANRADPYFPMRRWWAVRTSPHGSVYEVCLNKLGPDEVHHWAFTPTIDDDGHAQLSVAKNCYVSLSESIPVGCWDLPDWTELDDDQLAMAIADLVGLRDARSVVARLRSEGGAP